LNNLICIPLPTNWEEDAPSHDSKVNTF
jgi:hypothetical protein